MFKQLSNIKTAALLRNSDRRRLKQRVVEAYGISSELGDLLVPDGLMSQCMKTYTDGPCLIYLSPEGDPLWFTVGKGGGDLVPTVYTLWKKHDLLPRFSTPTSVTPVLADGADLMVRGVIQASSAMVSPQQLVSVAQRTSESTSTCGPPLAVGRLAVDLETSKTGVGVRILHTWKDHLFDMGSKCDPDEADGTASNPVERASAPKVPASIPSEPAFSREEVSDTLRIAVLQAISTTLAFLPSTSFPISTSAFYSSYILPFRPASVPRSSSEELAQHSPNEVTPSYPQIDIKHSGHKSLLAFFKFLDNQQILSLKDMKPEPLVLSVSASHPDVLAHRPYTSLRDMQIRNEEREKRNKEERGKVQEMEVKELWKPDAASGSAQFFVEGGLNSSALYSYSDLASAVNKYVVARQLMNPQDRSYVDIRTDEVLFSIVCAKGEITEGIEFLKCEDIVRRLSKKMQSWYELRAEGRDLVRKEGQLEPILVKVQKGRRVSTLVTGFEPFLLEGQEMAHELKQLCACATSVSSLGAGKTTGLEVLVQGDQIKRVIEFLQWKGVPEKWIKSTGGKKQKSKKV